MSVTVCVWSPWVVRDTSTRRVIEGGIGHASLRIGSLYLSFWPRRAEFTIRGAMTSVESSFNNFEQDKSSERGLPNYVTHLHNLDENRIKTFINRMFSVRPRYHVKHFNCSHPVKVALFEGTGGTIAPNFKVYADPAAYHVTSELPSVMQGGQVEDWIRETWNPISVSDYAEQLKRAVG